MMATLIDPVAGALIYDYGWCRPVSVEMFGVEYLVKLSFVGDEDRDLDPGQREAFSAFWSLRHLLLLDAQTALFSHYQSIRPEVLSRVSAEVADQLAPLIESTNDLLQIVRPQTLFFPEDFGSGRRVVGLLTDCNWDPSLGLAVRFENERIVGVGPQDIVL